MKKAHIILISGTLLFFGLTWLNLGKAAAAEFNHKIAIGANIGLYNTASSEMLGYDSSFDTVPAFSGSLVYFINKSYSLELSALYLATDIKMELDDNSGTLGEITQIPILFTARFQHPIRKTKTNVYLGLGGGYFINDFENKNRDDIAEIPVLNVENLDVDSSFGWHANVGAEMFIKQNYSLCLDLRVVFTDAEFELTNADGTKESKDMALNASVLSIGFKYYF